MQYDMRYFDMNYADFLVQKGKIDKLSSGEQKKFYERLLLKNREKTEVRIHASFCYGQLFY